MGGRGARSGIDPYPGRDGKMFRYGEEYRTLHQDGKVKFVTPRNAGESVRVPEETRNPDRMYATIDRKNRVKYISFHDKDGRKNIQIDLLHRHGGLQPHAHDGADHAEGRALTPYEKRITDEILRSREKYNGRP